MKTNHLARAAVVLVTVLQFLGAQTPQDPVPLKNWAAPLYWQPSSAEAEASSTTMHPRNITGVAGANPLVFVGMTPCRIMDTRAGFGFTGAFGPPSLAAQTPRTVPIQSSSCSVPAFAQAYSLNITAVPPGFLNFVTVYPTGQTRPNSSTLNSYQGTVVANAAIVAAGTNGSIDVYAYNPTDLIIDINGFYISSDSIGNTALGTQALASNTTGLDNTALGTQALASNTVGGLNTAIGASALQNNTGSGGNTAIGAGALQNNTNGPSNTAVGYVALAANTTGTRNAALGANALQSNTTGTDNIAIGFGAASNVSGGNSNNIHIGNPGASGDNNLIKIGNSQSSFFAAGIAGANVSGPAVQVDTATGQLGIAPSSRRFKEDIQDMGDASLGLMRLRPVTFRYKTPFEDGSKPVQYGLIAEEVEEVYPDLVARSADGQVETVKYQVLTPMLLNELQKEHQRVEQQAETIRSLENRLAALESALSETQPLSSELVH